MVNIFHDVDLPSDMGCYTRIANDIFWIVIYQFQVSGAKLPLQIKLHFPFEKNP